MKAEEWAGLDLSVQISQQTGTDHWKGLFLQGLGFSIFDRLLLVFKVFKKSFGRQEVYVSLILKGVKGEAELTMKIH